MPLVIDVTAGIIRDATGRYLITQRRRGSHLEGLWEFPGGKVDVGESLAICLRRELQEELGATFEIGDEIATIDWAYPDRTVVLHFFECILASGTIEPREGQAMTWISREQFRDYEFPPADRELIERLEAAP